MEGKTVRNTEALERTRQVMAAKSLEARRYQAMKKAETAMGWKLENARPYVGIQSGPKYAIMGPVLPATEKDLQEWVKFLRGHGWTEEEIVEGGNTNVSAYVRINLRWNLG